MGSIHKYEGLFVFSNKEILAIKNFINSLNFQGIEAASQVSLIGRILNAGKPLADYLEQEEREAAVEAE